MLTVYCVIAYGWCACAVRVDACLIRFTITLKVELCHKKEKIYFKNLKKKNASFANSELEMERKGNSQDFLYGSALRWFTIGHVQNV